MQEQLGLMNLATFAAKSYMDPEGTEKFFAAYFVPGSIWHQVHGPRRRLRRSAQRRHLRAASHQGLPEGGDREEVVPGVPAAGASPQVILSIFGNVLRHSRNNTRLLETLWPKVKLAVDVNFRMNETGR